MTTTQPRLLKRELGMLLLDLFSHLKEGAEVADLYKKLNGTTQKPKNSTEQQREIAAKKAVSRARPFACCLSAPMPLPP